MSKEGARRAACRACLRPLATCLCRWVAPVATRVDVLILQSPLEERNAKNSARLLHLSLPGSTLLVGETFGASELEARLHAGGAYPLLLYPAIPHDPGLGLLQAPPPDEARLQGPLRLVVLDGTWRKSRKMLYLNRPLQALPRLALRDTGPGRYLIRKAHAPDQLSTLEAACAALAQLDPGAEVEPLLAGFDGFVAEQMRRRPSTDE